MGKHGPNRFVNYLATHETVMEQCSRNGFVMSDTLTFTPLRDIVLLEGRIDCLGGLYITVQKTIDVLEGEGANALVQTNAYSYNLALTNQGNIFRYDSPHPDHNQYHHVHRYDVLKGDRIGKVISIDGEEAIPTLGEVIREAEAWYYTNYEALQGLA